MAGSAPFNGCDFLVTRQDGGRAAVMASAEHLERQVGAGLDGGTWPSSSITRSVGGGKLPLQPQKPLSSHASIGSSSAGAMAAHMRFLLDDPNSAALHRPAVGRDVIAGLGDARSSREQVQRRLSLPTPQDGFQVLGTHFATTVELCQKLLCEAVDTSRRKIHW